MGERDKMFLVARVIDKLQFFFNKAKNFFIEAAKGEWITRIEIFGKRIFEKIIIHEVKTAFWISWATFVLVVGLTFVIFKYRGDFLKNVFIEAHGMLFDLFVIATFILWLNKKGERRRTIERWKEEIDDFRGWDEKEAMHRIVGNIKRLNRHQITRIDLNNCYLEGANLEGANLSEADLDRVNLSEADLGGAVLRRANLRKANLRKTNLRKANLNCAYLERANLNCAYLEGANLSEANLDGVNLSEADLGGAVLRRANLYETNLYETNLYKAILKGADLEGADLWQADFEGADLTGARNLTIGQLAKVKTLYNAILNPDLEQQIKEMCPYLLNKPEWVKDVEE